MKIEIGESLGYSYLRHVKECWLVQTNWKPSPHWPKFMDDAELDEMFAAMKARFDDAKGTVFKQTRSAAQFLQQAEVDVMGIDQEGGVHAIDIAFHEAGVNYLGGPENRVLKKLLRTMMTLQAYHPPATKLHIAFASPKVNPGVQKHLKPMFADLKKEYRDITWELFTNDAFVDCLLQPTLTKAADISDTAELFMRSAKLLKLAGMLATPAPSPMPPAPATHGPATDCGPLQPHVQNLMQTLLEHHPTLLDEADLRNLMDKDYCKNTLGLRIGNFPLLREREDGKSARYYAKLYNSRFYVCSQWWKAYHCANAQSLLQFVDDIAQRRPGHPGAPALERCRQALRAYIG